VRDHIKGGLKILFDYTVSMLVFGVFFITFVGILKDNYYAWLPVYSFVMFLLVYALVYSDVKRIAIKEKKPQYNLKPYPLKGLVLGIIGFLPYILIELLTVIITFQDEFLNNLEHKLLNGFLGPLYFIIRLGKSTTQAYVIASLVVPFIAMIAYLAGYYGFEAGKLFKKFSKKQPQDTGPKFTKSPWNPTVSMNKETGKKKKKKSGKQGGVSNVD